MNGLMQRGYKYDAFRGRLLPYRYRAQTSSQAQCSEIYPLFSLKYNHRPPFPRETWIIFGLEICWVTDHDEWFKRPSIMRFI